MDNKGNGEPIPFFGWLSDIGEAIEKTIQEHLNKEEKELKDEKSNTN